MHEITGEIEFQVGRARRARRRWSGLQQDVTGAFGEIALLEMELKIIMQDQFFSWL